MGGIVLRVAEWPHTHGWWPCGGCLRPSARRVCTAREREGGPRASCGRPPGFRRGRRGRRHTTHPSPPGGARAASGRESRRGRSNRARTGRAAGRARRRASCCSSSTAAGARPRRSDAAPARGACARGRARARPTRAPGCALKAPVGTFAMFLGRDTFGVSNAFVVGVGSPPRAAAAAGLLGLPMGDSALVGLTGLGLRRLAWFQSDLEPASLSEGIAFLFDGNIHLYEEH